MNLVLLPADALEQHVLTDRHVINHLQTVLQVKSGDTIKVGRRYGGLGTAIVETISPQQVRLSHITCQQPPPAKLPVSVVLALPRPKVLRRLILDMTAMGVEQLFLVNSYRSEKSYWQSPLLGQIDSYVQSGLEQACDTIPMPVFCKKRLKPFVEDELPTLISGKQAIIAHPYAVPSIASLWQADSPKVLIIGAEGGWIDYEVGLFMAQGCEAGHMGRRILRTENAISVLCGYPLITQA